jgi:hypothetical protein
MNTARTLYRITRAAVMRELSRRYGFQTIGTGEFLPLPSATHYTLSREAAQEWAQLYPSAVIVSRGAIVASFTPCHD